MRTLRLKINIIIDNNCAPFTNCISKTNNTQVDDVSYIDIVMPIYDLIEYIYNYLKTSGILWQFYKDVPTLDKNGAITNFTGAHAITKSCKTNRSNRQQLHKNIEIIVPLKYQSSFWRILEMRLIIYEITLDLNWFIKCFIAATNIANQGTTFSITDTKLYVPYVTLSTKDKAKLLGQLKSGFKRTVSWNKYQPKVSTERPNNIFVLSFKNEAQRTSAKRYYLLTREIKN